MEADRVQACVAALIEAENRRDANAASAIISEDFIAITRSNGSEQTRPDLLAAIGNGSVDIVRRLRLDLPNSGIWAVGDECCLVRGIVEVSNVSSPGTVDAQFRNTFVFRQHTDSSKGATASWKLIAWQVTRLAQVT